MALARVLCGALGLSVLVAAPTAHAQDGAASATRADAPEGILKVTAPVPGSRVFIDGEDVGEAPITRYLPAGDYTVRVAADYHEPFVRRIEVLPDMTRAVAATFLPGRGTIEFLVTPGGAHVTIGKSEPIPTPVRLRDLKPGSYTYELTAELHEPYRGQFEFVEGKNLFIQKSLRSSAGLFEVLTRPEGADVYLDGELAGQSPLVLEDVPPAVHRVRIEHEDRATIFRTVDTEDGSKGVVDAHLPKSGGTLLVKTRQSDAEVSIDGTSIGSGKKVRLPAVERGYYDLVVTAPGMAPLSSQVTVPGSGQVRYSARLGPKGSELREMKPLTRSWVFWSAVGVGAAGVGVGTWAVVSALQPESVPNGDVVVSLP